MCLYTYMYNIYTTTIYIYTYAIIYAHYNANINHIHTIYILMYTCVLMYTYTLTVTHTLYIHYLRTVIYTIHICMHILCCYINVGIQGLKFKQRGELLERSYTLSTDFKTASVYGYQPVLASEDFKYALNIYLNHFRPIAVRNARDPAYAASDESSLFLNYHGEPETRVCRHVINFYEERMGVRVTGTILRGIFESAAADRLLDGHGSAEYSDALLLVNGHSSRTSAKYYNRCSVESAARKVVALHEPNNTLLTAAPAIMTAKPWGTAHPSYGNTKATRVPFSRAELQYMSGLISTVTQTAGDFTSRCLKRIRSDDDATPIFHKRHIIKSDRLRGGFRSNFQCTEAGHVLPIYRAGTVKRLAKEFE